MQWGGGGGEHDSQLSTFDAEPKSAKIPKSGWGGGGGCMMANFQLQTFDAESKSGKIPKSGVGGGGVMTAKFADI